MIPTKTRRLHSGLEVPCHDPAQAAVTERPTDPTGRQRAACQYAALVLKIAHRISRWPNVWRWGDLEDLFQEGMIALYRAIDGYDPGQGPSFMSYAYPAIYRHLERIVRERSGVIRVSAHASEYGEDELDEKFNKALAIAYKRARSVVPLEPSDASQRHCNDYRWSEQSWRESLEEVQQALRTLKERQADIIKRRAGLDREEETLEEIGQDYGISKERTRQIEAQAIARLKNWLRERDPDKYETQVARSKMFTTQLIPHPIDGVAAAVAPESHRETV